MDPFAAALDAQFRAPGSAAATYTPAANGVGILVRTIRGQPDRDAPFGQARVVQSTNQFDLQRAEVPTPTAGDRLQLLDDDGLPIAGGAFILIGEPMLDLEGMTWTCAAKPAP